MHAETGRRCRRPVRYYRPGHIGPRAPPESLASGRQALAALGAARVDDRATRTSTHASTETVVALTTQVTWLKGSFHDDVPILIPMCVRPRLISPSGPGQPTGAIAPTLIKGLNTPPGRGLLSSSRSATSSRPGSDSTPASHKCRTSGSCRWAVFFPDIILWIRCRSTEPMVPSSP